MLLDYYLWLKAFHIIAFTAWMAALLYLPRLFVYHVQNQENEAQSATFKVMERKLLKLIATPAMLATWALAILMMSANPDVLSQGWLHVKFLLVFALSGFHGFCAANVKKFAMDSNQKSEKFYRIINEVPAVLMVIIIILAIVKPF
jgi:putative membrane protein